MTEKPFELGQDFVDRVSADDAEAPSVQGAGASALARAVWRRIYMDTMIKHAELTEEQAADFYDTCLGDHDFTDDPEQAAISEIEYWDDDGDGPVD